MSQNPKPKDTMQRRRARDLQECEHSSKASNQHIITPQLALTLQQRRACRHARLCGCLWSAAPTCTRIPSMPHQRRCAPEPSCRLNLQTAQFVIGEPVVLREGALAPAVLMVYLARCDRSDGSACRGSSQRCKEALEPSEKRRGLPLARFWPTLPNC